MQNQLNGDLLNPDKSPFIFEGSGGDVIIDGILSDSNESSSSSGHHHHRHHHHHQQQQQHPPQLQHHPHHGHLNHSLNVTTLNSPMNGQLHTLHTSTENSQKRKFDEYLESNGNSNETINEPKKVPHNGKKTKGRVKIKMEFIDNKLRRYTTFSKRKTGIMKKAYELSTLTGTQVMLLVASETGHVYTFATKKLQPMITSEAGKALIQTCLNSPDPPTNSGDQRMCATGFEETDLTYSISDDSEKEDASSSSSSSAQYAPAPKENPVSVAASASSNFETNSHINTQSSQPSNICTTAAYTTLQNALPTSLFQTASIDSSNLVASKSISSSATGTTFTTTILGGVGPTSGNIASSQIQASSFGTTSINRNTNQQTLYKFSDVGTSSAVAANRIGSKITSTPVLSAGSVVFCTNPSGSSSITSVPVMYQTPSGVVYATTNSAVFPDNLILNLGHNIENLGPNSASASCEKILSSSCFVTPSSTSPQVTTKNGNSKGGSSKKVKK